MDITIDFGSIIEGSNPSGRANQNLNRTLGLGFFNLQRVIAYGSINTYRSIKMNKDNKLNEAEVNN